MINKTGYGLQRFREYFNKFVLINYILPLLIYFEINNINILYTF